MKVNFNSCFKGVDGNELPDRIAHSVAEALFFYGKDRPVSREDKFRAYCLSTRIARQEGAVDLTTEEASLIKEVCGEVFTAGGYGQVYDLIEGAV